MAPSVGDRERGRAVGSEAAPLMVQVHPLMSVYHGAGALQRYIYLLPRTQSPHLPPTGTPIGWHAVDTREGGCGSALRAWGKAEFSLRCT